MITQDDKIERVEVEVIPNTEQRKDTPESKTTFEFNPLGAFVFLIVTVAALVIDSKKNDKKW